MIKKILVIFALLEMEHGAYGMKRHSLAVLAQVAEELLVSSKRIRCIQCDYLAPNISSLEQHIFTHSGEQLLKGTLHKCTQAGCNYSAGHKSRLAEHMCSHTKKEPLRCTEKKCDYVAMRRCDLTKHMRVHHKE